MLIYTSLGFDQRKEILTGLYIGHGIDYTLGIKATGASQGLDSIYRGINRSADRFVKMSEGSTI